MKEFNGLLTSEIKKAEKKANELNNSTDCKVTGCSWSSIPNEFGIIRVRCEICHNYETRADEEVEVEVFMDDRRRSWAHAVIG
jgi:hypothetical protein